MYFRCWTPGTSIGVPLITRGLYLNLTKLLMMHWQKDCCILQFFRLSSSVSVTNKFNDTVAFIPLDLFGYMGATSILKIFHPLTLNPSIPAARLHSHLHSYADCFHACIDVIHLLF